MFWVQLLLVFPVAAQFLFEETRQGLHGVLSFVVDRLLLVSFRIVVDGWVSFDHESLHLILGSVNLRDDKFLAKVGQTLCQFIVRASKLLG